MQRQLTARPPVTVPCQQCHWLSARLLLQLITITMSRHAQPAPSCVQGRLTHRPLYIHGPLHVYKGPSAANRTGKRLTTHRHSVSLLVIIYILRRNRLSSPCKLAWLYSSLHDVTTRHDSTRLDETSCERRTTSFRISVNDSMIRLRTQSATHGRPQTTSNVSTMKHQSNYPPAV